MATSFFSLPLELRCQIYNLILLEEHHIFRDGLSPIFRSHLKITQEIYTLCTIPVITFRDKQIQDHNVISKAGRFAQVKGNKGLKVLLRRDDAEEEYRKVDGVGETFVMDDLSFEETESKIRARFEHTRALLASFILAVVGVDSLVEESEDSVEDSVDGSVGGSVGSSVDEEYLNDWRFVVGSL